MAADPQVFISFKNLDASGQPSRDCELAREVFEYLSARGLRVFFSSISLELAGVAAYKKAIDDALDAATILVAVGTSAAHLDSQWVRYEWDSFFNDILSGVKPDGRVFVYADGVGPSQLPRALRQTTCLTHDAASLERLHRFIVNAFGATAPPLGTLPRALLADGRSIEYLAEALPSSDEFYGLHGTPDRSHIIRLYRPPKPEYSRRLELLLTRFNTKSSCWPEGIVVSPSLGSYEPAIAANFLFQSGPFAGRPKELAWFISAKLVSRLAAEDRGDRRDRLRVGIGIARFVGHLHELGLCHADLSPHKVLIDFASGEVRWSEFDSIVVPGANPSFLGKPGYHSPEAMIAKSTGTSWYPSIESDRHALSVLLYQLLFCRHPLLGKKIHVPGFLEQNETLSLGEKALFVEHPTDKSNAIPDPSTPYTAHGPELTKLIERAFLGGLYDPSARLSAAEWETSLRRLLQ